MNIRLAVGIFFLVLAAIFAVSAARDRSVWPSPLPAGRARGRVAVVFAIVGLVLVLSLFLGH